MLEAWLQWASLSAFDDPGFREAAYSFFGKLAAELREHGKVRGVRWWQAVRQHARSGGGLRGCCWTRRRKVIGLAPDAALTLTRCSRCFAAATAATRRARWRQLLTLAVPPVVAAQPKRPAAQVEHLQGIASDVAAFSLMTYDYSAAAGAPGPNAPLSWQRENVKALRQQAAKGATGAPPAAV